MKRRDLSLDECAIAQAVSLVGDAWTLLVIREVAGGNRRFNPIQEELGLSRKVLTQRLDGLLDCGVLERVPYHDSARRHEYRLTPAGYALLPVLVDLQHWGATWLSGDTAATALTERSSAEFHRVRSLIGGRIPEMALANADGGGVDPVGPTGRTVLFCYPGTAVPGVVQHPPSWERIPGAPGCSLEARTFRDSLGDFLDRNTSVRGISLQRSHEQAAFVKLNRIPYPLLSDAGLEFTAALRLPTFRVCGIQHLKRLTLIVDRERVIREVLYPITDVVASVNDALRIASGIA
jgi:DNA-binding HxlR family transcriptional regulator/peroxiredoxin